MNYGMQLPCNLVFEYHICTFFTKAYATHRLDYMAYTHIRKSHMISSVEKNIHDRLGAFCISNFFFASIRRHNFAANGKIIHSSHAKYHRQNYPLFYTDKSRGPICLLTRTTRTAPFGPQALSFPVPPLSTYLPIFA